MCDMLIKQHELAGWIDERPSVKGYLLEAYRETIPDFSGDLLLDLRSASNAHIVNNGYDVTPKYVMGFQEAREQRQFIISSLYVHPIFRRKGFAGRLISTAKQIVGDAGFIQVAVTQDKLGQLDDFYRKLGFISINDIILDQGGIGYRDYFWSGRPIELTRAGDKILVRPKSA